MSSQSALRISILFLVLLSTLVVDAEPNQISDKTVETTHYRITFRSELQPLKINTMHSWIIHVETHAGEIVDNLQISIKGGMPQHNHGLPTEPQMTRYLGKGDYLIEGMKFHMAGQWQIELSLKGEHGEDKVLFDLVL